jgi:hemerythrin
MSPRIPPELVVGYPEIDAQHAGLFEAMEAAQGAAARGDLEGTRNAVAVLGDVLVAHFSAEEGFMGESLYPDRARHKAAHDLFMQDFALLGRELQNGLSDLATQWIAVRVPEWVRFHIKVNDSALGQFLSSKRYRPAPRGTRASKSTAS